MVKRREKEPSLTSANSGLNIIVKGYVGPSHKHISPSWLHSSIHCKILLITTKRRAKQIFNFIVAGENNASIEKQFAWALSVSLARITT